MFGEERFGECFGTAVDIAADTEVEVADTAAVDIAVADIVVGTAAVGTAAVESALVADVPAAVEVVVVFVVPAADESAPVADALVAAATVPVADVPAAAVDSSCFGSLERRHDKQKRFLYRFCFEFWRIPDCYTVFYISRILPLRSR